MKWDIFISHASEDNDDLVRPFAIGLLDKQIGVWYDEISLRPGDRLRESIDEGLSQSRYGVIILSPAYLKKNWTRYELDGLLQRFVDRKVTIIPIWHNLTREDIFKYSPTLADIVALNSKDGIKALVERIHQRVGGDTKKQETALREVFHTRIEVNEFPNDYFGALEKFRKENSLCQIIEDPEIDEHQYGQGGFHERVFKVTDRSGQIYLLLRTRRQWSTTSDDSTDYSEPNTYTILAVLPLMKELVERLVDEITSKSAKAS